MDLLDLGPLGAAEQLPASAHGVAQPLPPAHDAPQQQQHHGSSSAASPAPAHASAPASSASRQPSRHNDHNGQHLHDAAWSGFRATSPSPSPSPPPHAHAWAAAAAAEAANRSAQPSPAPPADPLMDQATLHELLNKVSTTKLTQPFSMHDVLHNPELAHAARCEFLGTSPGSRGLTMPGSAKKSAPGTAPGTSGTLLSEGFTAGGDAVTGGAYDAEVERQREAVGSIDQDVQEECKVNREIADLVVERLENSRGTLEGMSKMLQALAAAESAYATAMHAASRLKLSCEGDGEQLAHSMGAFSRIPSVVGQAHRHLGASLTSLSLEVGRLLTAYRTACKEVTAEAAAVQRQIEGGRKALKAAFEEHAAVCRAFDSILAERSRGHLMSGPDLDPWATEARLLREHKALQHWQDKERSFLKTSFSRAKELEGARLEAIKQVLAATSDSYRAALLPLQHDLGAMSTAVREVDASARLAELTNAAATASEAAESLAARQAETIEGTSVELLCSPEILRQGSMEQWDPVHSMWLHRHCVLTRAGFLHTFPDTSSLEAADTLSLARCQFEQGKAPCFNILEARAQTLGLGWLSGLKQRKVTFQASTVDECCEWAIAIREAIAVAAGKQLEF